MTKSKTTQAQTTDTVTAALTALASEFYAPEVRKENNEWVTKNAMAFTQVAVIKGICWTLENQIKFTVSSHRSASNDLIGLMRGAQGEVSDRQIESKTAWIERLEMQKQLLESVLGKAVAIYEDLSGKGYVPADIERADREKAKQAQRPVGAGARERADYATVCLHPRLQNNEHPKSAHQGIR